MPFFNVFSPVNAEETPRHGEAPATQWLLQCNHPNPGVVAEIEAILRDLGYRTLTATLEGFATGIDGIAALDPARPTVCYGPSFVPRALRYPELAPGIFFNPSRFRWSAFHAGWGEAMLSRQAAVLPLIEAMARLATGSAFVRPDEDSKSFDGGVHDSASFSAAIAPALRRGIVGNDTPVVVAAPIAVDAEWRIFIVGGNAVAASSYRHCGAATTALAVPGAVVDLALAATERWQPADVFCLDVALSGHRYGIVEANCFNAARLYGADARTVLKAVSRFVDRTWRPQQDSNLQPSA